jgi:protein-disulfide isomerase
MAKPSKADRKLAQERLAQERAAQAAADRRRTVILGAVVVVIVALIAVGVGLVYKQKSDEASNVDPLPANVVTDTESESAFGAYGGDTRTGVPVIDIYEDFQCPACKQFEDAMGETLTKMADSGDYTVVYHPMQFLDANLGNDSSARAASASGCAADRGKFLEFHNVVYENQPEREGAGFTDADLINFGTEAGITGADWDLCVEEQRYANWAKNGVQRNAEDRGVTSTPSFFVNGQQLDGNQAFDASKGGWQPELFMELVEQAAGTGN